MKHILSVLLFVFLFSFPQYVNAQEDCKVLVPEIDSIYTGKCKKGFAQGKGTAIGVDSFTGKFYRGWPSKGTYTWANGDSYTGEFRKGKRNGEGILTLKLADRDSIMEGLWEEDLYLGPKPKAPKIINKFQIDRYTLSKSGGMKERVLINFLQNGNRNTTITNLRIDASNGVETKIGYSQGFEFIKFPVTIKVSYTTMNKLNTSSHDAIFEFEIFEPGDWVVDIFN
ncbi:MAG: hypothetical protein J7K64_06505 [Bacteroidales bacterium]|nr:hypothetical protein [Bacteroidales bacterium]